MPETKLNETTYPAWIPDKDETKAKDKVLTDFITGRNIVNRNYNQLNNRNIYDAIDDWTMRWNGYIPFTDILETNPKSTFFINFTRNTIISYLAKVAMQPPEAKIIAVNKKNSIVNIKLADTLKDLVFYSSNEENGPARFLEAALEVTTKGTVVVYEGYAKYNQETDIPEKFDAETGKIKYKKGERIIFDNCFQRIVPIEDLYISNPYQPDIQKQPFLIWREITTYEEAETEYGHYANWKYVKPGQYALTGEPTTFYRNKIYTEMAKSQVEIIRYYHRKKNKHIVLINGIVLYNGPIPFKDGMYPFAKGIFEPYGNDFFWGAALPQKIMGDQDLLNTYWNLMTDKTYGSLLPFGLSSDLDDFIEDDILAANKIRKVGDINKWTFQTLPGVSAGEQNMLQMALNMAKEDAGNVSGGADAYTNKGGTVTARQVLLQQQEGMQKMGFSMNFLEDFERDRTELRINHILQFYSIPKIEKITGKRGKEIEQFLYRDVKLSNVGLSDGKQGTKIIKLVGEEDIKNPDQKANLQNELSVLEEMGEIQGTPTEAIALVVDTFYDYNYQVQVVKNSSYERNQVLDQASRHEYANWRFQAQAYGVPVDGAKLVAWVDEAYDVDSEQFTPQSQAPQQGMIPGMPGQQPGQAMQQQPSNPAATMQPNKMKEPSVNQALGGL